MENNYFFIDGSSLLSDIRKYKIKERYLKDYKLDILTFCKYFMHDDELKQFHSSAYRRIVFYFVQNDQRVKENLILPDFKKSRLVEDIQIKYCGKKIPIYRKAEEWLEKKSAPNYVTDSLYKSEKAVDTQICCDALVLLSLNKLDRLFLYTNDFDFIPLCQSIKTMGANINLIKLTEDRVNGDLVKECDAFYTFRENQINSIFGYKEKSTTANNKRS